MHFLSRWDTLSFEMNASHRDSSLPQKHAPANPAKTLAFVSAITGICGALFAYRQVESGWASALAALAVAIVATAVPVANAFLNKVALDEAPVWMENAKNLGVQRERILDHYARLKGTLVYWKNEAAAHQRLHLSSVIWSLLSAVLLPVLVQFYDAKDSWANAFMTVITTWTGLVVALAYTLKSEHRYQGMRQQESDYYDMARKFLDSLRENDPDLDAKVEHYLRATDAIRRTARKVETGSPPSASDTP